MIQMKAKSNDMHRDLETHERLHSVTFSYEISLQPLPLTLTPHPEEGNPPSLSCPVSHPGGKREWTQMRISQKLNKNNQKIKYHLEK